MTGYEITLMVIFGLIALAAYFNHKITISAAASLVADAKKITRQEHEIATAIAEHHLRSLDRMLDAIKESKMPNETENYLMMTIIRIREETASMIEDHAKRLREKVDS